jgi:phage shock protein PspC (stress-responsive transcriptional regulator)
MSASQGRWLGLMRPVSGRLLAGVCAALADRFGIDVTLVRLAFLLLVFAKGLGLLLYGVLWVLSPSTESHRHNHGLGAVTKENLRQMGESLAASGQRISHAWDARRMRSWPRPLTRPWMAGLTIALGVTVLLWSFGLFAWLTLPRILGLVAVAVGIGAILSLNRRAGS